AAGIASQARNDMRGRQHPVWRNHRATANPAGLVVMDQHDGIQRSCADERRGLVLKLRFEVAEVAACNRRRRLVRSGLDGCAAGGKAPDSKHRKSDWSI